MTKFKLLKFLSHFMRKSLLFSTYVIIVYISRIPCHALLATLLLNSLIYFSGRSSLVPCRCVNDHEKRRSFAGAHHVSVHTNKDTRTTRNKTHDDG